MKSGDKVRQENNNILEIDENLRIIGTAHVSSKSVKLVEQQIEEWNPDLVAVELCESRMKSLTEPSELESEDLLKIIGDGRATMILLQSALGTLQRKMGETAGEKPGAEFLAAIRSAEKIRVPIELIDRDIVITLRRAWAKMGLIEKWRVMNALLWDDEDDEVSIEEMLENSDLLNTLLEDARKVAPKAGKVLIDERDEYLATKINRVRGRGKVLAVIGAGHLTGVGSFLKHEGNNQFDRIEELNLQPRKPLWPKLVMIAIPLFLFGAIGWMFYNGQMENLSDTIGEWVIWNSAFAALGIIIARGHPLSIIVGAIASPLTSLNPTLAAGWFAGYTQLKIDSPTGKDAKDFLVLDEYSLLWKNRVGKVLLVTALGNLGSTIGAWLAVGDIIGNILG
tara:strand:+ start:111 stop:1295 length:1185 start_codon:yes stop_codon:yes gene_type:complete